MNKELEAMAIHVREQTNKEYRALMDHFGIKDADEEHRRVHIDKKGHIDMVLVDNKLMLTAATEFGEGPNGEFIARVQFKRFYKAE